MTAKKQSIFKKHLRNLALGAATFGLVAGLGSQALFSNTNQAYAEPVRIEGQKVAGFADVVEKVSPAVVSVRVKTDAPRPSARSNVNPFDILPGFRDLPRDHPFNRFFREFGERRSEQQDQRPRRNVPQQRRRVSGQGSGFFISEDGLIVTNNHVIANGKEFTIVMSDGKELEADLIGRDPRTDLALLQVKKADRQKFTYVKFADTDSRVGEWVVAIGNPFGLGGTVTAGIISARGRDIGASRYNDFIQIDAAVNKGNSGGPAFNLNGEVIGINTAIFSPSGGNVGIAFAIPAATAKSVIEDLRQNGKVVRGYLGVQIQPVSRDIADSIGLADTTGALVNNTESSTPAAKAGIRAGDVIVAVRGEKVENPTDLSRRIAGLRPDTKVEITILRNGRTQTLDVTLGTLPDTRPRARLENPVEPGRPATLEEFGFELEDNQDGNGVVVSNLDPSSALAEKGVRRGDRILEIDGQPVNTPLAAKDMMEDAKKAGKRAVLLRVENSRGIRFVAVPLTKKG